MSLPQPTVTYSNLDPSALESIAATLIKQAKRIREAAEEHRHTDFTGFLAVTKADETGMRIEGNLEIFIEPRNVQ